MIDLDDFEAEFGSVEPAPKKTRKKRNPKPAKTSGTPREDISEKSKEELCRLAVSGRTVYEDRDFFMPATARFFSRVLHIDQMTVNRRLRRVPPITYEGTRPLWEFGTALPYLIKPKMDVKTFRESMREEDLPPPMQSAIWNAKLARLRYLKEAGQVWPTAKVASLQAQMNKEAAEMIELWYDAIAESSVNASGEEVLSKLRDHTTELLRLLHTYMVELPSKSRTPSLFGEDAEFTEDMSVEPVPEDFDEDD